MTTVLIADDHAMVREGLQAVLEAGGEFAVVGGAADGREAVELARKTAPDVAVLDIAMPGMDGIEAAKEIRKACPKTKVVILSMHAALAYVTQAVRAGASGYVLKESAGAELIEAVHAAMRGEMFFSRKIAEGMAGRLARTGHPSGLAALDRLSDREREVLKFVAGGLSSKAVAVRLKVSSKTVDTYRSRAMVKLGVDNLAGLVKIAIQAGLLPVEPEAG